jgi:membrane fusion protein, multidrug efflux system
MKTAIIIMTVLLAASCSMSNDQSLKKQIEAKKNQISRLENEINAMEKQVTDTTQVRDAIMVGLQEINPEVFKHYITVFGNVEADQYARVSPEMSGQIRTIHVKEGQRVNKGDLLVSLNTDGTRSSIDEVKTNLELARTNFEKVRSLWEQGVGSEIQYLQAKSQKESAEARLGMLEAQLRMSQVRAPFNGIVDKIYLKQGDIAGPMAPVIEFVNLSAITIKADVSEKYIGSIHAGDKVEVSFSSMPDVKLVAAIARTSKVINSTNRTFSIELNMANPGEKIRPNMISSIKINDYTDEKALVVPSIVIKKDISGDYLYAAAGSRGSELVATKRYIKRGVSYEGITQVDEGLKKGDQIIVAGYNLVSSGSYLACNQ